MRWPWRKPGLITVVSTAVAVGLLPLPDDYYWVLRFLVSGVSIYYLSSLPRVREGEKWVLTGLAALHNPIVPVELGSRPLWNLVNVGTVVFFWVLHRRATRAWRR